MKFLKIACIISFLLIEGMQTHASMNFGMIVLYAYQFLHDIINFQKDTDFFWQGGIISILIIITLIILYKSRKYIDRYIVALCIIALFFSLIYLDGVISFSNIKIGFLIPFVIFSITSTILIILNFKKPK